jgi:hypothetical protein
MWFQHARRGLFLSEVQMIEMHIVLPTLGENVIPRGGTLCHCPYSEESCLFSYWVLGVRERDQNIWRLNCMRFINENNLLGLKRGSNDHPLWQDLIPHRRVNDSDPKRDMRSDFRNSTGERHWSCGWSGML